VRLLFASANFAVRNRLNPGDAPTSIPKQYFFPSINDAMSVAQQLGGYLCAPSIHMSVSLNGCRDLITLSNATSTHDLPSTNLGVYDTVSAHNFGLYGGGGHMLPKMITPRPSLPASVMNEALMDEARASPPSLKLRKYEN